MVTVLAGVLGEELKQSERLVRLLRDRLEAELRGDEDRVVYSLEVEREVLTDLVLYERERIACLEEIGLTLGHRQPDRLRIAELSLYTPHDLRDELLELRDRMRDVADELDGIHHAGARMSCRRSGTIRLFTRRPPSNPRRPDDESASTSCSRREIDGDLHHPIADAALDLEDH